jgi:hypothetical protein
LSSCSYSSFALVLALCFALLSGCTVSPPMAPQPVALAASAPAAKNLKREGPAALAPVRVGSMELSAVHWGLSRGLAQNGGYIAAHDIASGRELWLLKVYGVAYDPQRERDVQDTFIVEMKLDATGALVLIRDELERSYVVDPRTRSVQKR